MNLSEFIWKSMSMWKIIPRQIASLPQMWCIFSCTLQYDTTLKHSRESYKKVLQVGERSPSAAHHLSSLKLLPRRLPDIRSCLSILRIYLTIFVFPFLKWVGSHSLLQRIVSTQGSNLGLLHCRQILYHLSFREAPKLWIKHYPYFVE